MNIERIKVAKGTEGATEVATKGIETKLDDWDKLMELVDKLPAGSTQEKRTAKYLRSFSTIPEQRPILGLVNEALNKEGETFLFFNNDVPGEIIEPLFEAILIAHESGNEEDTKSAIKFMIKEVKKEDEALLARRYRAAA